MANGAELTLDPLRLVARSSLRSLDHVGRFSFLVADLFRGLAEWRIWVSRTLEQAVAVGYGSLFIVLLVAGFAGAVTSLQTGYQFTGTLPLYYAGAVISESMILELGPVLTALILAGRIGARYAAELGTMRVTEQIDALESLGRSPITHLLLPRIIAGILVIPALTMFANATGILVGFLTAKGSLGLTYADFEYGETVALLGPSGVGKSVTLKMINGLLKPDSGDVIVDGLHVPKLKRHELALLRSRIGYVFQYGALFDSDTVAENIRLGITDEDQHRDVAYCAERAKECLRLGNLAPDGAGKDPAAPSGGTKKRAGV